MKKINVFILSFLFLSALSFLNSNCLAATNTYSSVAIAPSPSGKFSDISVDGITTRTKTLPICNSSIDGKTVRDSADKCLKVCDGINSTWIVLSCIWNKSNNNVFTMNNNYSVGIGTQTPAAKLHLANDGAIVAEGTLDSGVTVPSGPGVRFMWNPRKMAIRSGQALNNEFDDANIGRYSVAFGAWSNRAGEASGALSGANNAATGVGCVIAGGLSNESGGLGISAVVGGQQNKAIGIGAFVGGGLGNEATGIYPFVGGGDQNKAIGNMNAIAGGWQNRAGHGAFVGAGTYNEANGYGSVVPGGDYNKANGDYSVAMGNHTTVSGARTYVWQHSGTEAIYPADDAFIIGTGVLSVGEPIPAYKLTVNGSIGGKLDSINAGPLKVTYRSGAQAGYYAVYAP
ncbi:MAG: hypothetical protein A2Z88_01685 [Omnitrophica WOR_2 bacterium GWA2_47_8]|nr:MAG: hypothetical protein A2Z88_01685 [Omnitrophica WOR_2 bacterium GWA2_47_8]